MGNKDCPPKKKISTFYKKCDSVSHNYNTLIPNNLQYVLIARQNINGKYSIMLYISSIWPIYFMFSFS